MTAAELKRARHQLGLSAEGLAQMCRVSSGRTVRRWEAGIRDIPGPAAVLITLALQSAEVRALLGIDHLSQ